VFFYDEIPQSYEKFANLRDRTPPKTKMENKKYLLTFDDAYRKMLPTAFSAMLKPVGSRCNMDCAYCYYLDKAGIYGGRETLMSDALLEQYVRQYIAGNQVDLVTFHWHGGEPLTAGIDFFRRAMALQRKYANGKRIENTIQTNGTLITPDWCQLFRENNFLVGVSIDGPADIHDTFRVDKGGEPTFERVVASIEMLYRTGVEFNTLSTVNSASEGRGAEVYYFMKRLGSHYMQFLPVLEHTIPGPGGRPVIVPPSTPNATLAPWSVSAQAFGRFMCDVFDEWVITDVSNYYVQLFDVALAQWIGAPPSLCSFGETCGDSLVVEHNGDVYSCDHFVYPEYRIGNIADGELSSMLDSQGQFHFGIDKRNGLPRECLRCKWHFACRGECPKHRFDTTAGGEPGLNALCEGYKRFFAHVSPYMDQMRSLLERQKPPALVMPWARARLRSRWGKS
jgi:uncharacterized protein